MLQSTKLGRSTWGDNRMLLVCNVACERPRKREANGLHASKRSGRGLCQSFLATGIVNWPLGSSDPRL